MPKRSNSMDNEVEPEAEIPVSWQEAADAGEVPAGLGADAPQDAPGEPEKPVEARDLSKALSNLEWFAGVPQDVPDDAEAWRIEHEWQLEHNAAYQGQFAPKPKK